MTVIQILGLVAAVVCLLAYWRGTGRVFDWCNATLWPVVGLASLQAQAWGPLLLNLGFGLAGVWHLIKGRQEVAHVEYVVTPGQASLIEALINESGGPAYYKED